MKRSSLPLILCLAALGVFMVTVSCKMAGRLLGAEEASAQPGFTPAASEGTPAPDTQLFPPSSLTPAPEGEGGESPAPDSSSPNSPAAGLESCPQDDKVCILSGSFLLSRPIGPGGRNTIDHSYRFGEYGRRSREAHHGVDFLNSTGTPVLAAADGSVVVAGDDLEKIYGPHANTYGNLVILKHELPGVSEPVYTLYGQLSQISVNVDDAVTAGQEIGLVGMSGGVAGSTLHFEVRVGENNYQSVRNPELWLAPLNDEDGQPTGALAGRVFDANGNPILVRHILIERLSGPGQPAIDQVYLKSYSDKRLIGLSPWQEGFAVSDLPEGSYQISFWLQELHQRVVEVNPSQLTVVNFIDK